MDVKAKIGRAIVVKATEEGVAPGMIVDTGVDEDNVEGQEGGEEVPIVKKMPERKTKQQKAKAFRLRAEVCQTN